MRTWARALGYAPNGMGTTLNERRPAMQRRARAGIRYNNAARYDTTQKYNE